MQDNLLPGAGERHADLHFESCCCATGRRKNRRREDRRFENRRCENKGRRDCRKKWLARRSLLG